MTSSNKLRLAQDNQALIVNGEPVHISNTGSIAVDPATLLKSDKVQKDFSELGAFIKRERAATKK